LSDSTRLSRDDGLGKRGEGRGGTAYGILEVVWNETQCILASTLLTRTLFVMCNDDPRSKDAVNGRLAKAVAGFGQPSLHFTWLSGGKQIVVSLVSFVT
jgi:hypothetical protein